MSSAVDVSLSQGVREDDLTTALDQTGFQQMALAVVAGEPPHGLGIKEELEEQPFENGVHHGRLYPNLDDLQNRGLLEKRELDRRTNTYHLTDRGRFALVAYRDWLESVDGVGTRAIGDEARRHATQLTSFNIGCLVYSAGDRQSGQDIKAAYERVHPGEINHGRLYPNLVSLSEKGLIDIGTIDKRTNAYELTDAGRDVLAARYQWFDDQTEGQLE